MPHDLTENGIKSANAFHGIYRYLRSSAERIGNDLCRAMERWLLDDEILVGGQR